MKENAALEKGHKLNIMMITIHYLLFKYYQQFIPVIAFITTPKVPFLSTKAKYERQISVLNGIVKVISATVNNEFILNSTLSITVTLFSITDLYIYIFIHCVMNWCGWVLFEKPVYFFLYK